MEQKCRPVSIYTLASHWAGKAGQSREYRLVLRYRQEFPWASVLEQSREARKADHSRRVLNGVCDSK